MGNKRILPTTRAEAIEIALMFEHYLKEYRYADYDGFFFSDSRKIYKKYSLVDHFASVLCNDSEQITKYVNYDIYYFTKLVVQGCKDEDVLYAFSLLLEIKSAIDEFLSGINQMEHYIPPTDHERRTMARKIHTLLISVGYKDSEDTFLDY